MKKSLTLLLVIIFCLSNLSYGYAPSNSLASSVSIEVVNNEGSLA